MKIEANSIEEALDKLAFLIGQYILKESSNNLIKHGNVDTGMLLRSIKIEKRMNGYAVIYPVPYASKLEYGNIPDPNVDYKEILSWVKRKLRKKSPGAERFAYFLTKRIYEKGINPSPYIRPAINKVLHELK